MYAQNMTNNGGLRIFVAAFAVGAMILVSGCAAVTGGRPEQGPKDAKPQQEVAQERAQSAILATLKDPDSAQFKNWSPVHMSLYGVIIPSWTWSICADVNSKNMYGGFAGFRTVQVYFKNGEVLPEPAAISENIYGCKLAYTEERQ